MKKLGLSYRVMKFPELVYDIGNGSKPSLKKFVEWGTAKGTLYVVTTSGHAQVVMDGWVTDQGGSRPIDKYWGRNKRVQAVEVIIPKERLQPKANTLVQNYMQQLTRILVKKRHMDITP